MLHALEPSELHAYRVPWRVDREHGTHPLVTNSSDAPLEVVRAFIDVGHRVRETQQWGRVAVDETVELCLCDHDPSEAIVTLAWFRPRDGVEYLWRFVL
jgi:hypothetical protein